MIWSLQNPQWAQKIWLSSALFEFILVLLSTSNSCLLFFYLFEVSVFFGILVVSFCDVLLSFSCKLIMAFKNILLVVSFTVFYSEILKHDGGKKWIEMIVYVK